MLTIAILKAAVPVATAMCFAQAAQGAANGADPISGGAGWIGAGLLGAVLSWLLFIHLPAKDKQVREMIDFQAKERLEERVSREKIAATLQIAMSEAAKEHATNLKEFQLQHIRDAERDREAFMNRNKNIEAAIQAQTLQLQQTLGSFCRFDPRHHHPHQPHQHKDG